MKTPAWHRFISEFGVFAVVLLTLAGVAWMVYQVLARGL